ncbi:MAG: hypothetical protein WAN35_12620 [Terracidiphilus sp.]
MLHEKDLAPFPLEQESPAAARVRTLEELIAKPPEDVIPLRRSIQRMVAAQWQRYVPQALGADTLELGSAKAIKIRFLAEMYLRACYSMIALSDRCPLLLRMQIRCPRPIPLPRAVVVSAGQWIYSFLTWMLPARVHRQLALMATMIGLIDQLLDEATAKGPDEAARVALLLTAAAEPVTSLETRLRTIAVHLRAGESRWQAHHWTAVMLPAMQRYCQEEALAATGKIDPSGMGYRWAGIEAAISGMWYVVGPHLGLEDKVEAFRRGNWNAEQRWMADTSLLMQMLDDWIDQDEDRAVRSTAVLSHDWSLEGMQSLYRKTIEDLTLLLNQNGVRNETVKRLFVDLYVDYIHTGLDAMKRGLAL